MRGEKALLEVGSASMATTVLAVVPEKINLAAASTAHKEVSVTPVKDVAGGKVPRVHVNGDISSIAKQLEPEILDATHPGTSIPRPNTVFLCSKGEHSSAVVTVQFGTDPSREFLGALFMQAIVKDRTTGEIAPPGSFQIYPAREFKLGKHGDTHHFSQDLSIQATGAAKALSAGSYELHFQIMNSQHRESPYSILKIQSLLDELVFVPIEVENCKEGESAESTDIADVPQIVNIQASLRQRSGDSYFQLGDVLESFKTALAKGASANDMSLQRQQIVNLRVSSSNSHDTTTLKFGLIFSNMRDARAAAIRMNRRRNKWMEILARAIEETLDALQLHQSSPPELRSLTMRIGETETDPTGAVCCMAETAQCKACKRGIAVEDLCREAPQVPGCASPADPERKKTVSQYLVQMILEVKTPERYAQIFTGSTKLNRRLQSSMQAALADLQWMDPGMQVMSLETLNGLNPAGTEEQFSIKIIVGCSSKENAETLSNICKQSSIQQGHFMSGALSKAFRDKGGKTKDGSVSSLSTQRANIDIFVCVFVFFFTDLYLHVTLYSAQHVFPFST